KQMGVGAEARGQWLTAVDAVVCAEEAHRQGRPAAEVEALLAKAEAAGKELGAAYGLRGLLALGKGRLGTALAAAEKAVAPSPREAGGGQGGGGGGRERAARGALADREKAAALSRRKDADVLEALAEAQRQAGQEEPARQTQREAGALRRGSPGT